MLELKYNSVINSKRNTIRVELYTKQSYIRVGILTLAKVLMPWRVLIELLVILAELYTLKITLS